MVSMPANLLLAAAHPNPYPLYAELVTHRPFAYDDALHLWVAAGAPAVEEVLTHPCARVRPPSEAVPSALSDTPVAPIYRQLVRMRDDPARQPIKGAIAATLGALSPAAIAERSDALARQLGAPSQPAQAPQWLSDFIGQLPVAVVASLLGAPDTDIPRVTSWLRDLLSCLGPGADRAAVARGSAAADRLRGYVEGLLTSPGEGAPPEGSILDRLARAVAAAEPGALDAVVANGVGLLMQSYEATAGLIGNTLVALAARPPLRERARDNAGLLRAILREVLRFDPPIQNTRRYLAHDAAIAGRSLRAGDAVLVVVAAANRDPALNDSPAHFDPARAAPRCLTFGAGAHACPGERLALGIAAAGVRHVLRAGLDLERLAAGVTYRPSVNARVPLFGAHRGGKAQ